MANIKGTDADKKMAEVERALLAMYADTQGIERAGDKIILPVGGSLKDWIATLQRYAESLEEIMDTQIHLDAHPDDALYALYKVIEKRFGKLMGTMSFSFFGPQPGEQRTISISAEETVVVPIGNAEIFGSLPIRLYVVPHYDPSNDVGGNLEITFTHKRAFLPFVEEIEKDIKQYLKENSIFWRKAITSQFNFMDLRYFDPERSVVYSEEELSKLGGEVFAPIIDTQGWLDSGRPLKRGVIFYGPYGSGKSLTLMYIAKLCEKHGWTYINVMPGDDVARVLRFADRYGPAVVAVEDIDRETGVERTNRVNKIVNLMDSVLSKGSRVMVVMTTNHKTNIQPAMLRPGRVDTSFELGRLDERSTKKVIENTLKDRYGNTMLEGELDADVLYEHSKGYTKAFLVEAVQRAIGYMLWRNSQNDNKNTRITQQDIVAGLDGLRDQFNLMNMEHAQPAPSLDRDMREILDDTVTRKLSMVTDAIGLTNGAGDSDGEGEGD